MENINSSQPEKNIRIKELEEQLTEIRSQIKISIQKQYYAQAGNLRQSSKPLFIELHQLTGDDYMKSKWDWRPLT